MKTEDADCESEPFLGEANLLENGVEEMKRDVKVDAPSTYWLSEFEQINRRCMRLLQKPVRNSQIHCLLQIMWWLEDLDQCKWDPSEMFDVSDF